MSSPQTLEKSAERGPSAAKSRILIIDKNPASLRALRLCLEKTGHLILEAENLTQAAQLMHKHPPALVLIGPDKPNAAQNQDLCRSLKEGTPALRLFLLDDEPLPHEEKLKAFAAGACASYDKSAPPEAIADDIKFFLGASQPLLEPKSGADRKFASGDHPPLSGPALVIDDDAEMARLLARHLSLSGLTPYVASSARRGILLAHKIRPRAILLDHGLPDENGQTALSLLKANPETHAIPVLMWTASMEEGREAECLSGGADGYLIKGVHDASAVPLWLQKVLRAPRTDEANLLRAGPAVLNAASRSLAIGTETISELTPLEFELLAHLISRSPAIVPWDELSRRVWNLPAEMTGGNQASLAIKSTIKRIRRKLGSRESCLTIQRGVGLRFLPPAS